MKAHNSLRPLYCECAVCGKKTAGRLPRQGRHKGDGTFWYPRMHKHNGDWCLGSIQQAIEHYDIVASDSDVLYNEDTKNR